VTKTPSQELVTLLLDEARVDPARLDEALHRQVVNGGALDTVLMEMGLVTEEQLLPLMARAVSLPAVEKHRLVGIDPGLISIFPRRVAERHHMLPFDRSGRRLSVAVAAMPKLEDLDSIGFMLSVWIHPFVTTEARLSLALKRAYDIPIPRRLEGLLGLLGEDADDDEPAATPGTEPSASHGAHATSGASNSFQASRPRARDEVVARRPTSASSTGNVSSSHTDAPRGRGTPIAATEARPVDSAWSVENRSRDATPLAQMKAERATPASALLVAATAEAAVATPSASPEQALHDAGSSDERGTSDLLRKIDEEARLLSLAKRARLEERVRWTVDDAIAELAMADSRDAFVDVILRFAHRRLSTVAMFVLTKNGATPHFEGWEAIDDVWSFRDITEVRIPTSGDHVLAKLHDMQSPFLGPIEASDPLLSALGRHPRAAILLPVFVGQRLAAVLYGDCGQNSIPPSSLAELHMVVPRFGNALRNLIVRQKQASSSKADSREADRVLPAAPVEGAIPLIELDIGDFDEISEEVDASRAAALTSEEADRALDGMAPASGGSFSIPPVPVDDVVIEAADVIDATEARPPPLPPSKAKKTSRIEHAVPPPLPRQAPPPLPAQVPPPLPAQVPPPLPKRQTAPTPVTGAVPDAAEVTDRHPIPGPATGPITVTGSGAVVSLDGAPETLETDSESDTPLPAELAEFDDDTGNSDDEISTDEGSTLAELRRRRAAEQVENDVRALRDLEMASIESPPASTAAETIGAGGFPSIVIDDPSAIAAIQSAPRASEGDAGADSSGAVVEPTPVIGHAEDVTVDTWAAATPSSQARDETCVDVVQSADAPLAGDNAYEPRTTLAEFSDLADDTLQPVASPGAHAREALLLATHQAWLAHVDDEADTLLLGLQTPGESGRATITRIAALGDRAMPALARYFPGVLVEHPFGSMSTRPEARDLSDALACLVRLGVERAAPILIAEVTHEDRLHRYAAVLALTQLLVPAALPRLAERVFDPEFRIALLALEALPQYAKQPGFEKVRTQLRDLIRRGDDFQRRRAIVAASELHDRDAIPALADTLGTRPKEISEEAHRALLEITKRDLGTSTRRWRAWFDDNAKAPRMEWLLQGLLQKEADIRRSAQTELNLLTGKYFGYRYDAPRSERDNAVLAWQRWWNEEADKSAWL